MLEIAACRGGTPNLHFKQGDMSATGLETGCAHVVTGSYALRNAPELGQTLAEIHRVLCPGGVAAFLEFSKPPERIAQFCEYWLLKVWGSFWGLVLHGNMEVYAYIAESLRTFPDRLQLRKAFTDRGFEVLQTGRLYFGVLEILVARKRNSDWAS
jgi:demethylmenaquinone methyltransferase/2-methoxy-6-polyprenyl-1,4-benzoquinol methylase